MVTHRFIENATLPQERERVRIHVAEEGPADGQPVLFVHGFPEGWFTWRAEMRALAAAGFRAIALDLRGYGESDKPRGKEHYAASRVADDVAAVARSLDRGAIPIVGHDWGGPIVYRVAMDHPEVVARLVVINGPHPLHFARLLRTNAKQRRASWYIAAFQIPLLPERMLARRGVMKRVLGEGIDAARVAEFERAFPDAASFTAPLDYYRAAARVRDRAPRQRVIEHETLVVWGMRDFALVPENLEGLEAYVPRVRIEKLPNVGHFVQEEAPAALDAILLRELRS